MPRWVSCAECAARYDADTTPFCPRCGSTVHGKAAPGQVPVIPNDPRRRRVQMGGAIFLFLGLTVAGFMVYAFAQGGGLVESWVDSYVTAQGDEPIRGGDLHVRVLADGQPVEGAHVNLTLPSSHHLYLQGNTTALGWYNATLGQQAAVDVQVTFGNQSLRRHAFVIVGSVSEADLDLVRDSPDADGHIGLEPVESVMPWVLGTVAAVGLLAMAAGGAAMSLRSPNVAVAGPIPLLLVTLILFVASLAVTALGMLALEGMAMWMVASGRSAFRRRK